MAKPSDDSRVFDVHDCIRTPFASRGPSFRHGLRLEMVSAGRLCLGIHLSKTWTPVSDSDTAQFE